MFACYDDGLLWYAKGLHVHELNTVTAVCGIIAAVPKDCIFWGGEAYRRESGRGHSI